MTSVVRWNTNIPRATVADSPIPVIVSIANMANRKVVVPSINGSVPSGIREG